MGDKLTLVFEDRLKELLASDAKLKVLTNPSDGRCMEIHGLEGTYF